MAIRRIIFHIGRHKSGTSSLQHFFANHREFLDAQGILYPFSGTRKDGLAHHKLSQMCHTGKIGDQTIDMIVKVLKLEVRPHHETILLSSEEFQNLASTIWIKFIIGQFPGVNVEILCYVREFADYMLSSFRQAVQNQTKFQTFSTFCNNRFPIKGFIRRWRKIGKLKLGWFHPSLLKDHDIVSDFLGKTNIVAPNIFTSEKRNPSLGGNLLWMKLAANNANVLFLPYNEMTRLMMMREHFVRPFYFSDERANTLRYKSSYNKTLEKILGPVPFKSWRKGQILPDLKTLDEDQNFIKEKFPYCDFTKLNVDPTLGEVWF